MRSGWFAHYITIMLAETTAVIAGSVAEHSVRPTVVHVWCFQFVYEYASVYDGVGVCV